VIPNNGLQNPWKKFGKAIVSCATGSAGTAGAGAGLLAAGSNVLSTGTKIGNFTPGTSIASQFFRSVLPQPIQSKTNSIACAALPNPIAASTSI
jgi:hypothetical protein